MADGKKTRIKDYIKTEKKILFIITLSGIIYNVGMTAGPWFEGKLAQCLKDIYGGTKEFRDMVILAASYVAAIFFVQAVRYIKRLYVRKFANNVNRSMKEELYHSMLGKSRAELEREGIGSLMTKAASDVDACVEGIRKFTTEIFDTGVVMISYLVMLFAYDIRLTLLSMIFPPIAYIFADRLKKVVTRSTRSYKESQGRLNEATYDRIGNAVTYRIYGQETGRDLSYEECLSDYEKKAVRANLWENSMQPVYHVISMMGAVCILWFGGKNVLGEGWTSWDIASFVTFMSCFAKLAAKSSKAAKLFNSVQKAQVSWKRIKPFLEKTQEKQDENLRDFNGRLQGERNIVSVEGLGFQYPNGTKVFSDISFSLGKGEIMGITGPVACGKSTLGKVFLGDSEYDGKIFLRGSAVYMGHEPELICGTIAENILLGDEGDVWEALSWVRMDEEIRQMTYGINSRIGNGGVTLSGGQQARIALARTLFHRKELLVLDDPFSAVDMDTEREIYENIRRVCGACAVIIISHRLAMFPDMDKIMWIGGGTANVSDHRQMMLSCEEYGDIYRTQSAYNDTEGGMENEG